MYYKYVASLKWNVDFLKKICNFENKLHNICDLSRDNVPNASRSNVERNGKRTGDERLGKPFETGTVNGWTAN